MAAAVGFRAVEIQAPYSESAERLAERVQSAGVQVVLINMPVAVAAIPGQEQAFREGLEKTLAYAEALRCARIHCLAGRTDDPEAEATFLDNVRWAADEAAAQGVQIMLEPLNTVARRNLALVLCRLGRWHEGIEELEAILRSDPDDVETARTLVIVEDEVRRSKIGTDAEDGPGGQAR